MLNFRSSLMAAAAATVAIASIATEANAQDHSVWLNNGDSTTFSAYFLEGEAIRVTCDQDCFDLDLFLYDSAGNLLTQDVDLDSVPVVRAPYDGTFTVEVSMPNCTHAAGCAADISSDHGFTVGGSAPSTAVANTGDSRAEWLYNGQSTTISGYFLAGESIYGTCDEDCFDLDLFLYDSAGNLVSQDVELDAYPIVTAPREGQYTIEVSMPNCSHSDGCAVEITSDYGF